MTTDDLRLNSSAAYVRRWGLQVGEGYRQLVPKELDRNLEFRERIVRLGSGSRAQRRAIWALCNRDVLFFVNTFLWTYAPKLFPETPQRPFITWGYQDNSLLALDHSFGRHDLWVPKSRDLGWSWMVQVAMLHRFLFRPLNTFLCVSRKEDLVDKTGDPDCLFWKIDYMLEKLPGWMLPVRGVERNSLHFRNQDNGSTIDGDSSTGDVGRGGRRTAMLFDENAKFPGGGYEALAASRDSTRCRVFLSTPCGVGNSFYDVGQRPKIEKIYSHWTEHPYKSEGLYLDAAGRPRSPWYDVECERATHPQEIAQELDIDFLGSDYQYFDQTALEKHVVQCGREAALTGWLIYDPQTLDEPRFESGGATNRGGLRLWFTPDLLRGGPPQGFRYCVACDVSQGTGATNSVASVANADTKEKVAEFATSQMTPDTFAEFVVALCRWFKGSDSEGAYLIWEANGPGRAFGKRVLEAQYHNIFYRRTNEDSVARKASDFPGWFSTPEGKNTLLSEYKRALGNGGILNRSIEALHECRQYVYLKTGEVAHSRANTSVDPSGARQNHADRVIADALLVRGIAEMGKRTADTSVKVDPLSLYSFAGRRRRYDQEQERRNRNWQTS